MARQRRTYTNEFLCGRPHKNSFVVKQVMWHPGTKARLFRHLGHSRRHITSNPYRVRRNSITPVSCRHGLSGSAASTSQFASALAFISRSTSA